MTDATTTAAESPSVAVTGTPVTEDNPEPARRWSTLTLAITAVVALVLGLGIGGVSGWAIANAQRPPFGTFQMGPGGDGQFVPPGDGQAPGGPMQQRGDGTTDDGSSDNGS